MSNAKPDPKQPKPGLGVDVGTSNLVACRQAEDGNFQLKHQRNMLTEIQFDATDFLERSGYQYVKTQDGRFFVLGNDALSLINAVGKGDLLRPMSNGILNPALKASQGMLNYILEALVGKPLAAGEPLRFSMPAAPLDQPEVTTLYHQMVLADVFNKMGYSAKPVNEALCNVYNESPSIEIPHQPPATLSGMGLSFGAGLVNSCFALRGLSLVEFSSSKCGDYIDKQVAQVTGEPLGKVMRIKESKLDLGKVPPGDRILQALSIFYDEMISRVLREMGKALAKESREIEGAVEIVICGGSSMVPGFLERFKTVLPGIELPFQVKNVRHSSNPFFSVAQGACLAARSDAERKPA
jgi:hypothetical protein